MCFHNILFAFPFANCQKEMQNTINKSLLHASKAQTSSLSFIFDQASPLSSYSSIRK